MSQAGVRPLWALVGDLLFRSRVEGLARDAGRPVRFFARAAELAEALAGAAPATGPSAVLLDLAGDEGMRFLEERHARTAVGPPPRPAPTAAPPTLGFYSHVDDATRRRALELGATRVVPRSAFVRSFAALLHEVEAAGA